MQNVSSSNSQAVNVPKLRFPGFEGEWENTLLSSVFKKISTKNKDGSITNVISNSAKNGLIPQSEYFDKDVANADNTFGYYIIEKGDFVYNPRKSTEAPFGPVSVYEYNNTGIVSPLYLCFKPLKSINTDFYKWFFKSPAWHRYIYMSGDSGARYDRVSMRDDVFFSMPLSIPNDTEQEKISTFLSILDERIKKQQQLIDSLKLYKRGYFKQQIEVHPQEEFEIKDIVEEYIDKVENNSDLPILSSTMNGVFLQESYFNKQTASNDISGYKIVPKGYFTYRSMSDTGRFHFNIQNIVEKGIVSPAYPVFMVKNNNAQYIEYVLNETDSIKNQLNVLKEGGTRYALGYSKFIKLKISLPNKDIQDKIANQVMLFNKLVDREVKHLDNLLALKKGLLQQMLI